MGTSGPTAWEGTSSWPLPWKSTASPGTLLVYNQIGIQLGSTKGMSISNACFISGNKDNLYTDNIHIYELWETLRKIVYSFYKCDVCVWISIY